MARNNSRMQTTPTTDATRALLDKLTATISTLADGDGPALEEINELASFLPEDALAQLTVTLVEAGASLKQVARMLTRPPHRPPTRHKAHLAAFEAMQREHLTMRALLLNYCECGKRDGHDDNCRRAMQRGLRRVRALLERCGQKPGGFCHLRAAQ